MSTALFRRSWKITIEVANDGVNATTLDLNNLEIEFRILRTLKPHPNQATITAWNLSENTRARLAMRNRPNPSSSKLVGIPVSLEAGYVDNTALIYKGDLREVSSKREGTDWKTVLAGDDGGRAWREAAFPKGGIQFKKGTPLQTVLEQCAKAMGVGLGNLGNESSGVQLSGYGATLPCSMTFSGSVTHALQRVIDSLKKKAPDGSLVSMTWSIQNGVLQILPQGVSLQQAAIKLTPSTGLLNSPEISIDSTVSMGNPQQFSLDALIKSKGKTPKAKMPKPKDPGIIRFETLLIPGLVPGRKVEIDSAEFKGGYVLQECLYQGQSFGSGPSSWSVNCVARKY